VLENNKVAFINELVLRSRFTAPIHQHDGGNLLDTLNTNAATRVNR